MNEQRLIDIEVKLAHHENTIAELNEALANQQKQLTRLEGVCDTLVGRVRALSQIGADTASGSRG